MAQQGDGAPPAGKARSALKGRGRLRCIFFPPHLRPRRPGPASPNLLSSPDISGRASPPRRAKLLHAEPGRKSAASPALDKSPPPHPECIPADDGAPTLPPTSDPRGAAGLTADPGSAKRAGADIKPTNGGGGGLSSNVRLNGARFQFLCVAPLASINYRFV